MAAPRKASAIRSCAPLACVTCELGEGLLEKGREWRVRRATAAAHKGAARRPAVRVAVEEARRRVHVEGDAFEGVVLRVVAERP